MRGLFDPIRLRDVHVRNRLWVPALCQYSAVAGDGVPTDWHLVHLGSFARGGAGLIIGEATAVLPEARISPHDTGIWNDDQVTAWRRVTEFVHEQGAAIGLQLSHAGRKGSTWPEWGTSEKGALPPARGGWPTVSASAIGFDGLPSPRELSQHGVADIVAAFAAAARRTLDAGFDLVELQAAHGYLIHQFLSPLTNKRTDAYGGDLESRARLLLDIVRAVRAEVGESVPILVRFSAEDYVEGGLDAEQTATVAGWAHSEGADFFDISSGGLIAGVQVPLGPGYQVPLAHRVRESADVPVSAVGLITSARQANEVIESGHADAVLLGRATLRNPHFPLAAAWELGVEIDYWPQQYVRARQARMSSWSST